MYSYNMIRNLPRVIAICGGKRCGKDTIAEHLSNKHGYKHVKIAAKLKQITSILLDFTEDQIEGNAKDEIDERYNISPRQAMQFFGTHVMQYEIQKLLPSVNRTFWVKSALYDVLAKNKDTSQKIVISDLRFVHEYKEILDMMGECFVIRVERPSITQNDNHISETEHIHIPTSVIVKNDKDMNALLDVIDKTLSFSQTESRDVR